MKRGQAEMLEWFPRLMMLIVALVVIAMLVRFFADREVDSAETDRAAYLYRLYYDQQLFTYSENGRAYPGVIDFSRFTDVQLEKLRQERLSSELTLTSSCGSRVIRHNSDDYTQHIGFARYGTFGLGGATLEENLFPVTVRNGDQQCSGILNITVVRSNS